jgi:hypothetical protein
LLKIKSVQNALKDAVNDLEKIVGDDFLSTFTVNAHSLVIMLLIIHADLNKEDEGKRKIYSIPVNATIDGSNIMSYSELLHEALHVLGEKCKFITVRLVQDQYHFNSRTFTILQIKSLLSLLFDIPKNQFKRFCKPGTTTKFFDLDSVTETIKKPENANFQSILNWNDRYSRKANPFKNLTVDTVATFIFSLEDTLYKNDASEDLGNTTVDLAHLMLQGFFFLFGPQELRNISKALKAFDSLRNEILLQTDGNDTTGLYYQLSELCSFLKHPSFRTHMNSILCDYFINNFNKLESNSAKSNFDHFNKTDKLHNVSNWIDKTSSTLFTVAIPFTNEIQMEVDNFLNTSKNANCPICKIIPKKSLPEHFNIVHKDIVTARKLFSM